jgi:hypothetical protein
MVHSIASLRKIFCELHRLWLGPIYAWAGEYRTINIGKGGFQFAHAPLIPRLMRELERGALRRHTPCRYSDEPSVAHALAEVHAELVLVHPFCDGNGRWRDYWRVLMALQAGLRPLDFRPIAGRGKRAYTPSDTPRLTVPLVKPCLVNRRESRELVGVCFRRRKRSCLMPSVVRAVMIFRIFEQVRRPAGRAVRGEVSETRTPPEGGALVCTKDRD